MGLVYVSKLVKGDYSTGAHNLMKQSLERGGKRLISFILSHDSVTTAK